MDVRSLETELRTLMLAGLEGDARAHRALLTRLSSHLRAYFKRRLARIGRSEADAEDLVQETLMAIHTRRHTYDRTQPLTPWVYVTVARPGEPGRKALLLMGFVFLVLLSAGLIALTLSPRAAWHAMLFSPQWSMCLTCIPLFALAPFAALIWTLRRAAPTHPALTGATAGMIAAASGAAIFSCCIPSSSLPFVTVWYGGVILLCALAGAVISPWFLRW